MVNGTLTVTTDNIVVLSSAVGTDNQTICINTAITDITYGTTGATGATFSGLPAGVAGVWAADIVTISGTPTVSGTFNYTVTLTGGCGTVTASGIINVTPPPVLVVNNPTAGCSPGTVDITAAAVTAGSTAGLILSYWTDASATVPYATPSTATAGTYYIKGEDGTTCFDIKPVLVTINPSPSASTTVTDVLCFSQTTGGVDLTVSGGTSPYTILWSNGATTEDLTGVPAGTYTVTITDANLCSANGSGTVSEPASALTATTTQSDVTTIGGNDGSITATGSGGIAPYLYSLDGGAYQASGTFNTLIAGIYTVTVQDMNLCTFPVTVTITEPYLPLAGSVIMTPVLCFGDATGSVTVAGANGVPPYEYRLNGGTWQSSGTFGNLTAGPYTISIRDAAANTFDVLIIVTQPAAALTVTTSQDNVTCNGDADGIAVALAAGGTGAYSYSWNTTPVQVNDTIADLTPGTYTVTVTDANSCVVTAGVTITEPAVLSIEAVPTSATCPDSDDGQIALEITGGTPAYSVLWAGGETALTRNNLSPDTYSVVVTDANGCAASASAVIDYIGTFNCVEIPQILTPDPADGHNDEWIIRNIDIYPKAEIKVYSRWGKLIYHSKNPSAEPWKGRYSNGKLVPTDSYHYILDLHDGSSIRSGVISVIR